MRSHPVFALLLCASALAGCIEGSDALAPHDDGDGSLMSRLQAPTLLAIDGEASLLSVNARSDQSADPAPIQFTIVDGVVDIRADENGDVVVHEFELALDDVSISADLFPPSGLELRDMRVRMNYPVVAQPEWTATTASAQIQMSVTADWSAVFNGNTYRLRSIELPELTVNAEITLDGGDISAQVSGSRTGTFWDWAEKFEMADLVVEVAAQAD